MAKLVTEFLDDAVKICPDKTAFVDNGQKITYKELQEKAYGISCTIVDEDIFRKPIAIFLDKGLACIATFLGVAYSGNFYTLLDTEMPKVRIQKIIDVLTPEAVVTDTKNLCVVREIMPDANIILFQESERYSYDVNKIKKVGSRILSTDLLYVLFTSGSTGIPKGVVTSHQAVVNYLNALTDAYKINENTVMGNQVPFYFVMSIVDIYGTLLKKGTMHIIPKKYFAFPGYLVKYISDNRINTISWVPSALCMIANLDAFKMADISCLKTVIFGGEVMPIKQLNKWRNVLPDTTFINGYGPTEVTDGCTYYIVDREFKENEILPIGIPFRNSDILVLDESNELVTTGVGELCVRSESMSYGYYNDPEKSAEVFVQNPLNPHYSEIIYKTGDLVSYNQYGELEYMGRKDFQIKHMGRRIELGEIESAISAVPEIRESCCLYDPSRQQIVLFYSGPISEEEMAEKVKLLLPNYMVPKRYIKMEQLPHNLNGKIDRGELKLKIC